jgi:hypothetical protein
MGDISPGNNATSLSREVGEVRPVDDDALGKSARGVDEDRRSSPNADDKPDALSQGSVAVPRPLLPQRIVHPTGARVIAVMPPGVFYACAESLLLCRLFSIFFP